jgi:phytoene dehydrogenase-like protein
MLPQVARVRFLAPYAERPLSISLFSATFGLSVRPAELGISAYSTFLLPRWMKTLEQCRESSGLLGSLPDDKAPVMTVVDYSRIDSGLAGPPYPVSVVGPDRLANWAGLDKSTFEHKRKCWSEAIAATIDREFPGFASHLVASRLSTAYSLARYLNAPEGAIYGFAPLPPTGPVWRGIERSPRTAIRGLYLASSYAGTGGFTGAIGAGASAAARAMAQSVK